MTILACIAGDYAERQNHPRACAEYGGVRRASEVHSTTSKNSSSSLREEFARLGRIVGLVLQTKPALGIDLNFAFCCVAPK